MQRPSRLAFKIGDDIVVPRPQDLSQVIIAMATDSFAAVPDVEQCLEDRKDVAFLSFSVDDDKADVVRFFADRKDRFPVYMASALSDQMDVLIFPTKLIIDGRKGAPGRIRLKKEGVVEAGELEARVAELLKKP